MNLDLDADGGSDSGSELRRQYDSIVQDLESLRADLHAEVEERLGRCIPPVDATVESRVKTWASICAKLVRKPRRLDRIVDLPDLLGVRLIALFHADLEPICQVMKEMFAVTEHDDKLDAQREDSFGYGSIHLAVGLAERASAGRTYPMLDGLRGEIQVRTLAQHLWATASHRLQYKHENDVPRSVRRPIHRLSAVLELVDSELDRVRTAREAYLATATAPGGREELNVDLLKVLTKELLPSENKAPFEAYDVMLDELRHFGVTDVQGFRELVASRLRAVRRIDEAASRGQATPGFEAVAVWRPSAPGRFFAHTGLVRMLLRESVGPEAWARYMQGAPFVAPEGST